MVNGQGRAVGVISQTDLLDPDRPRSQQVGRSVYYRVGDSPRELSFEEGAIGEGVVSDVMSPFVLSIGPNERVEDAARTMLADGVHRLLVIEGERIVGIISTTDVMRAFARQRARTA